jgi:vitamin B12 transporter
VKILIDDIPIETLSVGFPDLSLIPLESVDRIEILKGSASSIWGSSLGGGINIITKQPGENIQLYGGVSIGENSTRNYKAGISGRIKDTGYFFSASRFETDGFFDYQKAKNNYFYAKLTEEVSPKLKAELSYGYTGIDREDSGFIATELTYENHGRVMLTYTPKEDYELSIFAYDRHIDTRSVDIASNTDNYRDRENMYGGIFRSVWHHSKESSFSMGVEGNHGHLEFTTAITDENYDTNKWAVFANESIGVGALTLNAGARYDNDLAFGSELSPSAGIVYKIAAETFVRVNAARGFSPPPLPYRYQGVSPNSGLNAEKAWTYQAGIESDSIPGLWGKMTFYRADVTDKVTWMYDINDVNGNGNTGEILSFINLNKVRRQGVEVKAKTHEYNGLSLSYGYAFNDVKDLETDEVVKGQPRIIQNAGFDYKGPFETRGNINGRYIWWNANDSDNAKDQTGMQR